MRSKDDYAPPISNSTKRNQGVESCYGSFDKSEFVGDYNIIILGVSLGVLYVMIVYGVHSLCWRETLCCCEM